MPIMLQILKSVDFTKTEKARYLDNETFFLKIKIPFITQQPCWQLHVQI